MQYYTIKPATKDHLPMCVKLLTDSGLPIETSYADLYNYIDDTCFLVAVEEGTVIGLVLGEHLKSKGMGLWYIIVDAQNRHKGVASALLNNILMLNADREWFYLTAVNNVSEKLAEKFGFVKRYTPQQEMIKWTTK